MKKNKIKIATLKFKAMELRKNHQIPFYLAFLIYQLTGEEEELYILTLMEFSQHLLRVKGYYRQYKDFEKVAENQIKDGLTKLGYECLDVES